MSERQSESGSSSSSGVDYVLLCDDIVERIYEIVNRRKLLNGRQCKSLADYLSAVMVCVRVTVDDADCNTAALLPGLAALYRYYEKAEVLVKQCGEEDWCAAAVFQDSNDMSFINIWDFICSDFIMRFLLWKKSGPLVITVMMYTFYGKPDGEDTEDLRQRLEGRGRKQSNSSFWSFWIFGRQAALKQHRAQHLARYLLKKYKFQSVVSMVDTTVEMSFLALKSILWEKGEEPIGMWGEIKFLGAGSGASGVLETTWLGIPCAKKVFHAEEVSENMFMKEALIMARLKKHPCIVDFICCGNGKRKGDRFIAMELMEKSLYDLIKERKGVHFSLEVALDIILQIADGVKFLHEEGVAHRDLKSQNVLVKTLRSTCHEDYYCVKLADFGTCKSEVEVSTSYKPSYPGVGTTRYRAPEAFPNAHPERMGKVDWMRVDAYSFAMTCAHVLTMKQPFENMKVMSEFYVELMNGRRPILSTTACPKKLVELVMKCWSNDRFERPRFDAIYSRLKEIVSEYLRGLSFERVKGEEVRMYEREEEAY